jgi:hypothetical protein
MLSKLLSYIAITFPSLECAARRPDTRADSLFATTAAVSAANAGLSRPTQGSWATPAPWTNTKPAAALI